MKGAEIREKYLSFFEKQGHTRVPSAPLVPKDKSLLFNIAGMVPFKPYFLGEITPPYSRATSSQTCIRTNDIERVGATARHLTFFEMLGNFSFGDYFKRDAIRWGWEFLTEVAGLEKSRLYVSVYEKDDEAARLWGEIAGLTGDRIIRLGRDSNFWEVGPTGPCGPCSEIIYDQGASFSCGRPDCAPGCDCDRYMEVWNLVFMEFNQAAGELHPLPKKNIDTGMGLERLAAILQKKKTNFDTDLIFPIIEAAEDIAGRHCSDASLRVALNIVGDHMRAAAFLIAAGVRPSNEERGYVLRRLIRRAAANFRKLGVTGPSLYKLVPRVVDMFANPYADLARDRALIEREIQEEEGRFAKTLDVGVERLTVAAAAVKKSGAGVLPGAEAFELYDTYGFPLELTEELLNADGIRVDRDGFNAEMEAQKKRARAAFQAKQTGAEAIFMSLPDTTRFDGYDALAADAVITHIAADGAFVDSAADGDAVEILFDRTALYAERGGQVGDAGSAQSSSARLEIEDCRPVGHVYVHRAVVRGGRIRTGDKMKVSVDAVRRHSIMKNHTGTHLIHAALRQTLGEHVKQAGSLVAPDRLRFDFTHASALGDHAAAIETLVNTWILQNLPVQISEMTMAEAQKTGAMMLFDEKYGDRVRVVRVGSGESVELCGGTHCRSTGEIGMLKIISDTALAAGVRRIEAVTGMGAVDFVQTLAREVRSVERDLKTPLAGLPALFERMQKERRDLEKKLKDARSKGSDSEDLLARQEKSGDVTFIVAESSDADLDALRGAAERLRDKIGGPVLLGARADGGVQFVMAVPKSLTSKFHAGKIIGQAAAVAGGRGGGRPDFAQAGGKDASKLDQALDTARSLIRQA